MAFTNCFGLIQYSRNSLGKPDSLFIKCIVQISIHNIMGNSLPERKSSTGNKDGSGWMKLEYLRPLQTSSLISRTLPQLSSKDVASYVKQIGANFHEFHYSDKFEQKTYNSHYFRLIKKEEEAIQFVRWYNGEYQTRIDLKSIATGTSFPMLKDLEVIDRDSEPGRFLELANYDIFSIKSMNILRKSYIKRWFESCCSWFYYSEWSNCEVIITREGIIIKQANEITDFFMFNSKFDYVCGLTETGYEFGVKINTCYQKVKFKTQTAEDFFMLTYCLSSTLGSVQGKNCRFDALAFTKDVNYVNYLVDADNYYKAVSAGLQSAKHEIFICGWWISPELPLIRPYNKDNLKYRLDNLLNAKARQGVIIRIVAFNSPAVIPNNSEYTLKALNSLNPNIRAISHPAGVIPGVWSHHEKLVVIDQKVAFMGGLDLCYGRYDPSSHPINSNSKEMYPGIEYNNNRIKDFEAVNHYERDALPRESPRMPWHDVALRVEGRVVCDLSYHFIQYWNNSILEAYMIKETDIQQFLPKQTLDMAMMMVANQKQKPESSNNAIVENEVKNPQAQKQLFNAFNFSKADDSKVDQKIEQKLQEKNNQQMSFNKEKKSFVDKLKFKKSDLEGKYLVMNLNNLNILKKTQSQWEINRKNFMDECQLLRSASTWSIGLESNMTEKSINNAYIELIEKAKYFIYIENQFFISAIFTEEGSKKSFVQNQVAIALYQRIKRAIEAKQKFKVTVIMPLIPGMAGEINEETPMALRLVMHWQYKTICRGGSSLIERISMITNHPEDYIEFYGLRQHGILEGRPVTEIIYVHTKLMIVDDEQIICGSANINDRSQKGNGDSELCLVFLNGEKVPSQINGKKVEVNKKALELRKDLYRQHFGFSSSECQDPLHLPTLCTIRSTAKSNTEIYRQLFGCYPDDNIKKLSDNLGFGKTPTIEQYEKLSPKIVGHIVEFPLHYLQEDKLANSEPSFVQNIMI